MLEGLLLKNVQGILLVASVAVLGSGFGHPTWWVGCAEIFCGAGVGVAEMITPDFVTVGARGTGRDVAAFEMFCFLFAGRGGAESAGS